MTAVAPFSNEVARQVFRLPSAWNHVRLKRFALAVACINLVILVAAGSGRILRAAGLIDEYAGGWFSISGDNNIVENAGCTEFLLASAFLAAAYMASHRRLFLVIAALVAYLVIDDFFLIHDQAREWLGNTIGFTNSFYSKRDFGELVYAVSMLLIAASAMATVLRSHITWNDISQSSPVIVSILAFLALAVGLDQFRQILEQHFTISLAAEHVFNLLEDGGEFIAQGLTLIAASAIWSAQRRPRPAP